MKIEKLSSDRLQITLTFDDMNEQNINFSSLSQNKDELNRFITDLLIKARQDTDFDLLDGQFVIRVLQNETELVLTIIRINSTDNNPAKTPVNKNAKYKLVEKKQETPMVHSLMVEFRVKEDFAAFTLSMTDYINEDAMLYKNSGKYFLYLKPLVDDFSHVMTMATEFGITYRDETRMKILFDGHDKFVAKGNDIISVAHLI